MDQDNAQPSISTDNNQPIIQTPQIQEINPTFASQTPQSPTPPPFQQKSSQKIIIAGVFFAIIIMAGAFFYIAWQSNIKTLSTPPLTETGETMQKNSIGNQSSSSKTITPTPVAAIDLDSEIQKMDTSINDLDSNISGADSGLNDKTPDLTEN